MCKLTIECDKCNKLANSIKSKIRRNNHAVKKLKNTHPLYIKLMSENDGLQWTLKQLYKTCDCNIINNNNDDIHKLLTNSRIGLIEEDLHSLLNTPRLSEWEIENETYEDEDYLKDEDI